ncbi:MAG TPA: hypothetical protein VFM15_05570 [Gammaproteobacteria bacterium]|nr:hypothetical protein [Gammaproteobacteria bacterium]
MSKCPVLRHTAGMGLCVVLLLAAGCSSSKPYTLVAQTLPLTQSRVVAATIDVKGRACTVRVMISDTTKVWTPVCTVLKDQSGFKSFNIGGTQVDFGAVPSGFKVLSASLPTIPAPSTAAAPAAASVKVAAAAAKPAAAPAPAQPALAPAVFPEEWGLSLYPGRVSLQGQNLGFLITSAKLDIQGSNGQLDVTFKASYSPLHLDCTVLTNSHGDFHLIFNPAEASRLTGGGNYNIQLVSEGSSITGNIWDSHGFDSWTPSLPPQWVATEVSAD